MWFTCLYVSSIKQFFDSRILVCGMSKVWWDTDGCTDKYRCALDIYLMTVLSSSYGIIMNLEINAPGNGNNVVYGLNVMYRFYLKEQMEIVGKLGSNDTSKIGMLPSASKYISIKFSYQCINILNNK